ncbi:hypothetical protein CIG75_05310 [Tumebacillus algifaecis]|uniref:HTH tetR-type domain-containing protein n=1 Tax=Tumebacillus algifaecis TaxID=1214604 RepID=A0A223CYX4_9BACL|nr:TetR family transcriptional regulator [Tumebacillus algifaecis]ASS74465.1 hypothetical protein CIG75_05310 [Tumebacillus algifaecis]
MSETVKTKILDAAKRLFAEKGFEATSVRQICEEAGANVALVSYHFGGKEKLLFAVLESAFPGPEIFGKVDAIEDPVERLSQYIAGYMDWMRQEDEVHKILMQEIMVKSDRHHQVGRYPILFWQRLYRTMLEGQQLGVFQFVSIKSAMLQTMGALLYPKMAPAFVMELFDDEGLSDEELVQARQQYILRGLGVHPTESGRGGEA